MDRSAGEAGGQSEANLGPVLGAILFLTGIFFLSFGARVLVAPLLPAIEDDLGLSHAEAGSLIFFLSVGIFTAFLGSGFVASLLSYRRTIILSELALGAALIAVGLSSSLWGLRLGLLAMGLAGGLYVPSGMAVITNLVRPQHWGKALAVHELAPNLGMVAAPLAAVALLGWFSWRGVMLVVGCLSLAAGLAFARFGRGGEFKGRFPSPSILRDIARQPSFWIMAALISMGIGAEIGVYAMLPLYLVSEHGLEQTSANLLLALSRIPGLGIVLLAGWISDRLGLRRALAVFLTASGVTVVLLGLGPERWLLVMVFLQPAAAACFFPPALAALSRIGSPQTRSLRVSLAFAVAFVLGGGVIPAGIGVVGDMGFFGAGFGAAGGLILLGLILLPGLRLSNPQGDGDSG